MMDLYSENGNLLVDGIPIVTEDFEWYCAWIELSDPRILVWNDFYAGRHIAYRPVGSSSWKWCIVLGRMKTAGGTPQIILCPDEHPDETFPHKFHPNEEWLTKPLQ